MSPPEQPSSTLIIENTHIAFQASQHSFPSLHPLSSLQAQAGCREGQPSTTVQESVNTTLAWMSNSQSHRCMLSARSPWRCNACLRDGFSSTTASVLDPQKTCKDSLLSLNTLLVLQRLYASLQRTPLTLPEQSPAHATHAQPSPLHLRALPGRSLLPLWCAPAAAQRPPLPVERVWQKTMENKAQGLLFNELWRLQQL